MKYFILQCLIKQIKPFKGKYFKMKTQIFFIALSFLTLSLNAASAEVAKPSFDCAKAQTEVEKMVCDNASGDLQNLDRYMNEVYTQLRNELKKSSFKDKEQRLAHLLQTQRNFIKDMNLIANMNQVDYEKLSRKLSRIYKDLFKHEQDLPPSLDKGVVILDMYEKRTIALLKLLGEVLDSNNKELCEYAKTFRTPEYIEQGWQEIKPSVNDPLYTMGFCLGSAYNYKYCTYGELTQKQEYLKDMRWSAEVPVFIKDIDINNDGKKEKIMFVRGDSFSALYILDNNNKLDEKASDKIYGDDLHFTGAKTDWSILSQMEIGERENASLSLALPKNKVSSRFGEKFEYDDDEDEDEEDEEEGYIFHSKEEKRLIEQENIVPMFTLLFYDVMEFKGKNYIHLTSNRFFWDESKKYPNDRIYLLDGDKRELKCTYFERVNYN